MPQVDPLTKARAQLVAATELIELGARIEAHGPRPIWSILRCDIWHCLRSAEALAGSDSEIADWLVAVRRHHLDHDDLAAGGPRPHRFGGEDKPKLQAAKLSCAA